MPTNISKSKNFRLRRFKVCSKRSAEAAPASSLVDRHVDDVVGALWTTWGARVVRNLLFIVRRTLALVVPSPRLSGEDLSAGDIHGIGTLLVAVAIHHLLDFLWWRSILSRQILVKLGALGV